ncbi:MAG: MFS transporter [Kordiimonadaceae bacterium]|nr:MFS transporter [Kordiimonadaceae bacterium]
MVETDKIQGRNGTSLGARAFSFIATFLKKPLLAAFLLGMTSGFPLTIILGIMTVWLSEFDVQKTTIGIFTLATLPYSLKILWSPLLDRVRLGALAERFGRRRSWVFIITGLMTIAILNLSSLSPDTDLWMMGAMSVSIGFLSASLDIVIDAYRIEVTEERDLGHSAGMYTWGYRISNLIAGAGVFTMAHYAGWGFAVALLPLLVLPGIAAILWLGEPKIAADAFLLAERQAHSHLSEFSMWLYEAVILPFKEFTLRNNWYWILLFIVLVKFGDVMAAMMTGPFLEELDFTLLEMAYANKAVGALAAAIGGGLGIFAWWWLDTFKALLVSVLLMMVTNLGFVWLALMGHDTTALAVVVGLENMASGIGGTIMIAYFGSLCNLSFTATQYALLTMLSSVGRGFFGGFSGVLADAMNWPQFFLLSTVLAVPGLVVLIVLWKKNVQQNSA